MFKRTTIRTKILISLSMVVLLVLGSNYFIFETERQSVLRNSLGDLALLNNTEAQMLNNALEATKKRTADFSSDGYIRDAATVIAKGGHNNGMAGELGTHLIRNKLGLDPNLLGIDILDNKGVTIASTDPGEVGKDESNDVYYPGTEDLSYGSVYVSDFLTSNHFEENTIAVVMAAPLINRTTGLRVGTLINFVKAEALIASLGQTMKSPVVISRLYASARSYITTKAGLVIGPAADVLKGKVVTKRVNPAIKCGEIGSYVNDQGVMIRGATTCLDNGWMLVTEIAENELLEPTKAIEQGLAILIVLLLLIASLVFFVINKQIIRPIQTLAIAAKRIGEGHLDVRAELRSSDEIGSLGREFDEMTQKLRGAHMTLAKKIREITQDFEKFKLAVAGASDHVIITDIDGKIIYANRAAEKMTGYSESEIIGNRPSLWGKQMPQEFYQRMWRTIKEDHKAFHGEVTNRRKNGELYVAEIHISPLFDDQGVLYGFVAIERDVTKQKEVDRSKTEFVSIASHQLRTPLTIINWYVEMLSSPGDRELSQKQLQYLEEITRASKRMIELVNSLLNVSRIEMGTFMIEPKPVNFADEIDSVLKDLTPQIEKKRISIVKNIEKNLPLIPADPKLLRMVIQNLLANAVKYTQEEGAVTVNIDQRIGDILITVADTGIGIPVQQQAKIFQKFFRADNAREKEPDGNGLGLYIIKSIVESGGGKIWFSSEEGKGTVFYVTLPLSGMQKKEGIRVLTV